MELSIILPAHNEEQFLAAQLEAILQQQCDCEWDVIVVDNNSTDNTAAIVERFASMSDRVQLVAASEQSDKSYAVRIGVDATDAELLVFCDADDVVAPGWLEALRHGLTEHRVVTGPNELDELNPPWLAGSRGRSGDLAAGTFFGIFPTIRGNNYALRRSIWSSLGPLSPGHQVEDLEYSHRCWTNGIEIVGIPSAVVHYRYRSSVKALWRQGFGYGIGRVRIARLLKDHRQPRPPRFAGWRSWLLLLRIAPELRSPEGRARWTWVAANRLGQAWGSVRERTLML